jgi:RNA polymerase sigma-70 factor (ECF subfamily)
LAHNGHHPLAELDEKELVQLAKNDEVAFGEIYRRYVEKIYNYIYYRTSNKYDAEDLTARVFQRALKHIPNYEDRGVPFSAWLYRIAHNLVVNHHRDRKRRKIVPLDDLIVSTFRWDAPEKVTERREDQEELLEAINHLPEDRQQLLILKFVERLSNAEIGNIMGRSEGAIKSLYHRTLIALREEMAGNERPPDRRTGGFGLRRPKGKFD